mmetsp:Transcript_93999/g.255160  ORF Transcript_93999/g.255160 Transcript_93999/m.255160 type:complete len:510 (+) Transcript_93999:93-1622(+)
MATFSETLKYVVCPPLVLFKPRSKAEEFGHAEHAEHHHHHHPAAAVGQHSAVWPLICISMVLVAMYRFSEDEAVTDKGAKNLLIGAFLAPAGAQVRVLLFWACVLLVLTYVTYLCRPAHIHGASHLLIPEIVVLGVFFLADFAIDLHRMVDTDGDGAISMPELAASPLMLAEILPARWLVANFCMVLSATIVQTISPEPYTKESFVYSICWSLILSQAVSQFLYSSMRRGEELAGWQSTFAAVIYGPSLYFYTHGIALVIAVVFHKHQGAEHPPTLIKVVNVLRKADPMYMLQIAVFGAALAAANLLPPKLDHGCESWLEACTKGLYAGHITMLTMSAINAVALGVAYNIVKRKVDRPPRPSYESALVWATGCLATFIWCEMFVPGRNGSLLKFTTVLLGTASHYVITGVSADTFSGRMETSMMEAVVMLFWASTQCIQGLALEHRAATSHHGHGGLSIHGLLNHLGEFGLCEFGLIATLAWATKITEEIVHLPTKGGVGSLRKPLLGK